MTKSKQCYIMSGKCCGFKLVVSCFVLLFQIIRTQKRPEGCSFEKCVLLCVDALVHVGMVCIL